MATAIRDFLTRQGCIERDVADCELALVEACNNAIQHANGGQAAGIEVEAFCGPRGIELRIVDHTPGFVWPANVSLPDAESERGRGLFLIQSVMSSTRYLREPGRNTLVLRKTRSAG